MYAFVIFTVLLCGAMGIVWSKADLHNALVKIAFLGISVWGIVLLCITPHFPS